MVEQPTHTGWWLVRSQSGPLSPPLSLINDTVWRRTTMPLQLDHTIVPAYDKVKSASSSPGCSG